MVYGETDEIGAKIVRDLHGTLIKPILA